MCCDDETTHNVILVYDRNSAGLHSSRFPVLVTGKKQNMMMAPLPSLYIYTSAV